MTKIEPFAVYRCDLIQRYKAPQNEVFISAHWTATEAMTEADRLKKQDPTHSYVVGCA